MTEIAESLAPTPRPRRALRTAAFCAKIGCGKSTLYELVAAGVIPQPLKGGPSGGATLWLEEWGDAYLDRLVAQRDAKAA